MNEWKMFTEEDLIQALEDIGSLLDRMIPVYLIGGCAMTFVGRKIATKDVDMVLTSTRDVKDLSLAAERSGFDYIQEPPEEYDALGAWVIMENERGMRLDIFDRQVSRGLVIDEEMKSRARFYRRFENLDVYLMSNEDIFLFKGITERESDLEDLRILSESGIDWQTIEEECLSQRESGTWAHMLWDRLLELRNKYGIRSPIIKSLKDHSNLELLKKGFTDIIGERTMTFTEISNIIKDRYEYSPSWTRQQLKTLVEEGILEIYREGRRHIYRIADTGRRGSGQERKRT